MIVVTVSRENEDLLWKGAPRDGVIQPDGTFTFKGGAQPIQPPYRIAVIAEDEESDGSPAKG
jgi:hypothetical protein